MATDGRTPSGRAQMTSRTPTVCLGPFPVSSALSLLVLMVLCGCAHTAPSPLTDATQAQLGTIAVVAAQFTPEVDYRTPGRGGAGGAAIGTAKGVGLGVLGAVGCMGVLAYCAPCLEACAVAVGTPYFAVRYAVDQATEGVAADTIAASEAAVQAVLGARNHEAVVGAEVFRLAAVHTRHQLMPLPDEGLPSAAATAEYKPLTAYGIDTVIEVALQRVALQSRTPTRVGWDGIWSISAADLNPYLTLVVTGRTRVLKTTDGTELYGHTRDYIGRGATFIDWGANDAQLLREGLEQLLREMAGEIIVQVFGVAPPPAPEPEAPPPPTPAQEPARPGEPSANDAACPTRG